MKRKRQEESDNDDLPDNEDDHIVVQASTDETKNGSVNKPPTGEELRAIKDATDLYRSNSFKLQVNIAIPLYHTPY